VREAAVALITSSATRLSANPAFDRLSHFSGDFEDSKNFGWSVDVKGFDWKKLIDNKDKEIDRLNGIYKNLLSGSGVKLIEGRATLVDAHTVKVCSPLSV
jgi:glutathione reductase (NADPH)